MQRDHNGGETVRCFAEREASIQKGFHERKLCMHRAHSRCVEQAGTKERDEIIGTNDELSFLAQLSSTAANAPMEHVPQQYQTVKFPEK